MILSLGHFLVLGAALFCISVAGIFLNRKNVIVLLMSIELMLLAVNVNFVAFSRHLGFDVVLARSTRPGEVVYGASVSLVTTSSIDRLAWINYLF